MLTIFIWMAIVAALAVYVVILYNGLVTLKHGVGKAWSNIDVLLKQRHDELPKLVDAAQAYMAHERSLLEKLTALLPGEHHLLYTDVDSRFPNHHPDPTVPENLRDLQIEVEVIVDSGKPVVDLLFKEGKSKK